MTDTTARRQDRGLLIGGRGVADVAGAVLLTLGAYRRQGAR